MTVYVVQKLGWEYNDDWFFLCSEDPVVAYADRAQAEATARQLEAQERAALRGVNLAERFCWELLCLQGGAILLEKLRHAGVPEPTETDADTWWEAIWSCVAEETLWELCDAVRFAEVVAVEIEP